MRHRKRAAEREKLCYKMRRDTRNKNGNEEAKWIGNLEKKWNGQKKKTMMILTKLK